MQTITAGSIRAGDRIASRETNITYGTVQVLEPVDALEVRVHLQDGAVLAFDPHERVRVVGESCSAELDRALERVRDLEAAVNREYNERVEVEHELDAVRAERDELEASRARIVDHRDQLLRDLSLALDRAAHAERDRDRTALEGAELVGEYRREQAERRAEIVEAAERTRRKASDAEPGSAWGRLEFGRAQGLAEALQLLDG